MSKSQGNFLTLSVLKEKGFDPLAYRYLCLTSHYRKQLVFSFDILENASQSYQKLKNKVSHLERTNSYDTKIYEAYDEKFKNFIADDLATANALTLVYDLLKSDVDESTKYHLIQSWDQVFSLGLCELKEIDKDFEKYILKKIEERRISKLNKNFALADSIRDELFSKGVLLKDGREGTTYEIL